MTAPRRRAGCALALAFLALAGCGGPAAAPAASLKLFVAEAGLYRLTGDELRRAGVPDNASRKQHDRAREI